MSQFNSSVLPAGIGTSASDYAERFGVPSAPPAEALFVPTGPKRKAQDIDAVPMVGGVRVGK